MQESLVRRFNYALCFKKKKTLHCALAIYLFTFAGLFDIAPALKKGKT